MKELKKYDELLETAKRLEAGQCTDWAEEHEDEYNAFAEACETEWRAGNLTDEEFTVLILTGTYDYDGELPGVDVRED